MTEEKFRPVSTHTPQQIANYFLERGFEDGNNLTPLKLLRMVYIAYGWNLALTDQRLFSEEIQAWEHGPVVPTLYHEFKRYQGNPIEEYAEDYDETMQHEVIPRVSEDAKETRLILGKVWATYQHFSAWTLRDKTHEKDGPWDRVYDRHSRDVILNDDDIKNHYKTKISQYLEAARSVA